MISRPFVTASDCQRWQSDAVFFSFPTSLPRRSPSTCDRLPIRGLVTQIRSTQLLYPVDRL